VKLGIFADVHGNLEALKAVVRLLQDKGATRFICCGDIVGYGPDPNDCVEIVRRMHCTCVAGNHDYGAVGKTPVDRFNSIAAEALLWTRSQLTESNRLYLESLPLTAETDSLFVVHSSPSAPGDWKYVLTVREAADEIDHFSGAVCAVGHSHRPLAVERLPGKPGRLLRQDSLAIRPYARYLINAGSVGQPRDGDPRACCLLYDDAAREMKYLRVAYDMPAVQARIRAAGMPEHLASRLETGR
jgi:predicted phosphodiesterase